MTNLWTLAGLSPWELLRRTVRESWRDEVFGQGGRMSFYQFLAAFPTLLVFLAVSAHAPHLSGDARKALGDLSRQVLPEAVAQLLQRMTHELSRRPLSGWRFLSVCAGALWALLNSTWAMVYGLNRAYEVEERRSRRRLTATIVGLTAALALAASVAVFLMFSGAFVQAHLGFGGMARRVLEWLILIGTLLLCFAVLYRFAPHLPDPEWRWSTPGAVCALVLWLGATFGAKLYFDRVNDYARSYGHLNSVAMLLLWLYVANGAVLIGGEVNSEIEKAARKRT